MSACGWLREIVAKMANGKRKDIILVSFYAPPIEGMAAEAHSLLYDELEDQVREVVNEVGSVEEIVPRRFEWYKLARRLDVQLERWRTEDVDGRRNITGINGDWWGKTRNACVDSASKALKVLTRASFLACALVILSRKDQSAGRKIVIFSVPPYELLILALVMRLASRHLSIRILVRDKLWKRSRYEKLVSEITSLQLRLLDRSGVRLYTVSQGLSDELSDKGISRKVGVIPQAVRRDEGYKEICMRLKEKSKYFISMIGTGQEVDLAIIGNIYKVYDAKKKIMLLQAHVRCRITCIGVRIKGDEELARFLREHSKVHFERYVDSNRLVERLRQFDAVINFPWPDTSVPGGKLPLLAGLGIPVLSLERSEVIAKEVEFSGCSVVIDPRVYELDKTFERDLCNAVCRLRLSEDYLRLTSIVERARLLCL